MTPEHPFHQGLDWESMQAVLLNIHVNLSGSFILVKIMYYATVGCRFHHNR